MADRGGGQKGEASAKRSWDSEGAPVRPEISPRPQVINHAEPPAMLRTPQDLHGLHGALGVGPD